MDEQERPTGRDIRIDQVGFTNELAERFAKPLKDKIKAGMVERKIELAEADFFQGLLITSGSSTIDPAKFLRAFQKGEIKREEFLSSISVSMTAVKKFLGPKEIAAMADPDPVSQSLRISRKKGAEIQLVEAVKGLGEAIKSS